MSTSRKKLTVSALALTTFLLPFSTLKASANWGAPEYLVTDRAPDPDLHQSDPYNTPSGGNSTLYEDQDVGGTVETTFNWTSNGTGDDPPQDVYVIQNGYARWSLSNALGPPPMGGASSFQEVAFKPRTSARLRFIQAATQGGLADDGLGDVQEVTNGSNIVGISQGYKVVLCHPVGNTLTVPGVTLSASATRSTAMQHYHASWYYTCQVMSVEMTRNDVPITSNNHPEADVMVGEKNTVAVSLSPLPSGEDVEPITYAWTITGGKVKDSVEAIGPPNTGTVTAFDNADLAHQSLDFFWYDGALLGESRELSCVVTVDGKPITIKGKCKVYRPNVESFTGEYSKTATSSFIVNGSTVKFSGITFTASVKNASSTGAVGTVALQQMVNTSHAFKVDNGVQTDYVLQAAPNAVDSGDDSPRYHQEVNHIAQPSTSDKVALASGATVQLNSSDAPEIIGNPGDRGLNFNDTFKMYVVYKPTAANSIWVTLAVITWDHKFKAVRGSDTAPWTITSSTPQIVGTTRPTDPTFSPSFGVLNWTLRGQAATLGYYYPNPAW